MEKLAKKVIARLCANGTIQEDDREVYEYSLNILLVGIFHSLTAFLIGFAFGMFVESLVLFVSFFLVRKFAGGFHAPKQWLCYLTTIVTVTGALLLARFLLTQSDILTYVFLGVPVLIILLLSPVEHPNKPLNAKEKKVYRLIAWGLCGVLTGGSLVLFHLVSRAIGLAVGMGLVLSAFALIASKAEQMLMRAPWRSHRGASPPVRNDAL